MKVSRDKWNSKYSERLESLKELVPNNRLKSLFPLYQKPEGRALDLACGLGGNSLFLANLNYQVEAVDLSDVAIRFLKEKSTTLPIHARALDLTNTSSLIWPKQSFDLIVITYYLDRSLFPIVRDLLKEDGFFFMETYYQTPYKGKRIVSEKYQLKPKELLTEFADWTVLFFEESEEEGRQTILCQNTGVENS